MVADEIATGKAVVFRSSDAANWTREPAADVPQVDLTVQMPDDSSQHGVAPMYAVVAGPNGYLAAGWRMDWQQAPNPPAALWHSADGVKWTEESAPMGGYTYLWALGNRNFLNGTSDGSGFPLWYSDDGTTWHQATAGAGSSTATGIYTLTQRWDGSLAATGDPVPDPNTDSTAGLAFLSTDNGATWQDGGTSYTSGPGSFCEIDGVVEEGGYLTFDKGANWQQMADIANGPAGDVRWISLGNAFLVASPDFTGIDLTNPDAEASIAAAPTLIWLGKP
jgi:hypothetical protein